MSVAALVTAPWARRRSQWRLVTSDVPQAPGSWIADAACRGRRMWYTTLQAHHAHVTAPDRAMEVEALAICAQCPVLDECRAWALTSPDPAIDHVAGGMTPRQRYKWRKAHP